MLFPIEIFQLLLMRGCSAGVQDEKQTRENGYNTAP